MPRKVNSKNPPVASSEEEVFQGVLVTHPAGVGNAAPATEVTVDLPPRPQAPEELQSPPPRGEAGAVSPQRGPMEGWQELKAEGGRRGRRRSGFPRWRPRDEARPAAAILETAREAAEAEPTAAARRSAADRPRRLPPVKEFTAAGGDWSAFVRRFEAAYRSVNWMEDQALRALPTALDDDRLAAFWAIPADKKATLQGAYREMAAVYNPPSATRGKFLQRCRGNAETPVAYHGALMALGLAAYSQLDQAALDSLLMEKMLELASEMGVVLPVIDEDAQTSLWAARCLQAHETLRKRTRVAAWTGKPWRETNCSVDHRGAWTSRRMMAPNQRERCRRRFAYGNGCRETCSDRTSLARATRQGHRPLRSESRAIVGQRQPYSHEE
ncbi:unnamed protein product [Lampetra fluviatilis]